MTPSSSTNRRRRRGTSTALLALLLSGTALPAAADPAGPTDYRNEVIGLDPATDGAEFSIVGGDAFLRVEVEAGTELVVIGYFGEPYLRILANGTVEENQISPSVPLNTDRYADDVEIDRDQAQLPPHWQVIGNGGAWAWHDHRVHWMSRTPPPGRSPGDVIYGEVSIPVVIDDVETRVSLSLTWVERPAPVWPIVGALVGALLVGWRRRRHLPALGLIAAAALVVGVRQYAWLPPETDPSVLQWAVPVAALAFVGAGLLRPRVAAVAGAVAAAEIAGWGLWRRESMWKAILPTSAPYALDRAVTAACLVGGLTSLVLLFIVRIRTSPAIERTT